MNYEKLKNDFDKMSEQEQWDFLVKNKEIITIILDNNYTTGKFNFQDKSQLCILLDFKVPIGDSWGVDCLFRSIGINFENS